MSRRSCPFVHTGRPRVCKVGHAEADSGDRASVKAHGTLVRVQSRTRDRRNGAVPVRLCTRDACACAKSDTRRPFRAITSPFVHTPPYRVCKVGHETGRVAPHLSACAHGTPARV